MTNARMNASKKNVAFPNAQKKTENANKDLAYAAFSDHWEKSRPTTAAAAIVPVTGTGSPRARWRAKADVERKSTAQRTQSGTSDFFMSVQLENAATATAAAMSAWGANSSIRFPG